MRGGVRLVAALGLLFAAAPAATPSLAVAAPDTLTVNTSADFGLGEKEDPNACTGEEPGGSECPLRAAVEYFANLKSDAATEEVVAVPPGTYTLTKGALPIGQTNAACEGVKCPLKIRGAGAGATIIGKQTITGLMYTLEKAGPVTVEGVTLTGGSAISSGGAIWAPAVASLTVRNSVITENVSNGHGGGIWASSPVTIEDSSITGNRANGGGGIEMSNAPLTLLRSTVSGNEAAAGGGGGVALVNQFAGPRVSTTVLDSTVSGNSASGVGGGIDAEGNDELALRYSTVAGNTGSAGGGVGGSAISSRTPSMTLEGAILAGDAPTECTGFAGVTTFAANIMSGSSSCPVLLGPAPVVGDPKLGPLSVNGGFGATMPLLRGSPAINAGGSSCPATEALDERRGARPRGAACDLGAFETASDAGVTLNATPDPVPVGGSLALSANVVNSGSEGLSGVTLVVPVPAGTSFVSAPAGCNAAFSGATTVTCMVGSLAPGQSQAISIIVRAERVGALSETASVSAAQADYEPANDTATIASVATTPTTVPPSTPGTRNGAPGPVSTLIGRTFTFDGHGNVTLRVKCAAGASSDCRAAIAIYSGSGTMPAAVARAGRKAALLAIAHVTIKSGKTVNVRLRLNRTARKARAGLHARVLLSTHTAAVVSHSYTVTLRRATKRHR